jgi:hypothetical protein
MRKPWRRIIVSLPALPYAHRFPMTRPFHDRVCKMWTECGEGEYEVLAPTAFEDRVCEATTKCDVSMIMIVNRSQAAHGT